MAHPLRPETAFERYRPKPGRTPPNGTPSRSGARCGRGPHSVNSYREFTSKPETSVYSQGIPIPFPRYDLPEDGPKTLAATGGQQIGLTATGHAGYPPAALTSATLANSCDGGVTWAGARVSQQGGGRTATVHHAGASGAQVTLRTDRTDAHGDSVTRTVVGADDVR
ncbi:hypothetical protein GCM10022244_46680 [Streptomyces gulbargensis]|uniref:Uncharacterized protein n=1 Tax=Streptomyces gulbargensis TaxID=364901 RepID=A0ABP7N1Q8_9ACTN